MNAQVDDYFGTAVVVGDFNNDSFDDVAMSIPGASHGSNKGAVKIFYGAKSGLSIQQAPTLLYQNGADFEADDVFGYSLAAGDFNGDGYDDLAVGVPFEDIGPKVDAGQVDIIYGSPTGLPVSSTGGWTALDLGLSNQTVANFGWSLAAADFNGDGYSELVVSAPNEDVTFNSQVIYQAGVVRVYDGSSWGITGVVTTYWQGHNGVFGVPETSDHFGWSLAVGDFDRPTIFSPATYPDLAIGTPYEDYGATDDGIVQIFMGSTTGLSYSTTLGQNNTTDEVAEDFDLFGFTLTAGNLQYGGAFGSLEEAPDELIVGVPYEDIGTATDAGLVHVFFGSSTGVTTIGNLTISQNSPGIFGVAESNDNFGLALTVGHFDPYYFLVPDPYGDLVIAAPGESYHASRDGVVTIVYGSANGPDTNDSQFLFNVNAHNDTTYGLSLAVADFDNSSSLLIGVPGQTIDGKANAGVVEEVGFELKDIIFANGFKPL